MPKSQNRKSKSPAARSQGVLYLGAGRAEWLGPAADGESCFGHALASGTSAQDWTDAALAAVKDAGAKPGACVLMLGADLASHQIVKLPPMKRRELQAVLMRKAARQLSLQPGEVLYHARDSGGDRENADEPLAAWFLTAMAKEIQRSLGIALRSAGFRVARTTTSELACCDRAMAEGEGGAVLLALVEKQQSSVTLINDGHIIARDVYEGDYHERADLGPSLIQGLRSYAASWRRQSRGSDVGTIAMLGLAPEHGARMKESVQLAFPNASVLAPPETGGPQSGRAELLGCATQPGGFADNLSMKLPPSRNKLIAGTLLMLVAVLVPAGWLSYQNQRTLQQLERETSQLESQTLEFAQVNEERSRAELEIASLNKELARFAHSRELGLDLGGLLEMSLGAFGTEAALLSATFESPREHEIKASLRGSAVPDPERSTRILSRIGETLRDGDLFNSVEILPPSSPPTGLNKARPITFSVEAIKEAPVEVDMWDEGDPDED